MLIRRHASIVVSILFAALVGVALLALAPSVIDGGPGSLAQTTADGAAAPGTGTPDLYAYLGAASCSGSTCHGSTTPRDKLDINQNEFFIWSQKDRHTKAYEVLTQPDSRRIAKNLNIAAPEKSARCLVCHAVHVDPDEQGTLFDVTEGVTCEACHGPAERWLGPHIARDWNARKAAATGMYDTKDLTRRTERCLACHLGAGEDIVDHELIGAGHPRLKFEVDTYSHVMPAHWRVPKAKAARDWLGARTWAVGQAVALRNQIRLLADSRQKAVLWPDFVHFECYACHHAVVDHLRDLTDAEKEMQQWRYKDYDGKPGRLVWNASSYAVFRHLVAQVSAEQGRKLDELISAFHNGLTGRAGSRAGFEADLSALAGLTERLVGDVKRYGFTGPKVIALMRGISGDGRAIANAGFQSAEQAVLALASLYESYRDTAGPLPGDARITKLFDALYKNIKDGHRFQMPPFVKDLQALHQALGEAPAGGAS